MKNEKITASFATRLEASAYRDGIVLLQDLCPDRDIRVSGPWAPFTAGVPATAGGRWTVNVQCMVHAR